jgi:hypothetical protein
MLQLTEEDLRSRVLGAFVGLSVFYTIGAITFVAVERENELFTYEINQVLYNDMKSMYQFKHCDDSSFKNLAFCRDQREFSEILEEFFNDHGNSVEDKEQWTYLGSVFFLTQLTATIGYGNTAKSTRSIAICLLSESMEMPMDLESFRVRYWSSTAVVKMTYPIRGIPTMRKRTDSIFPSAVAQAVFPYPIVAVSCVRKKIEPR